MLMDDIDRKILKLLQENARMSLKTIAEKTFLSSPAVSARIEKLEKDGVIAGYHAMVDPMKLGYHILAFINLDVIPEDKPKFYAFGVCTKCTGMQLCNRRVFHVNESCFSQYHGAGYFYWTASEIWKDQYTDRILHPRRPKRRGCG